MKKLLFTLGGVIVLIILALAIAPFLFKDKIEGAVNEAMKENLNADVYYNTNEFSLSFFKNFPNLTVGMQNFGIVNHAPFEGDTLVKVGEFNISVNVASLISGKVSLNNVSLKQPDIRVKVLQDGRANYDIAKATEETAPKEETASEGDGPAISINHWEIIDGRLSYDDLSSDLHFNMHGLQHRGAGDFAKSNFDMTSKTHIEGMNLKMEKTAYLENRPFDLDATVNMDLEHMKFTLKENTLKMNDLALHVEGFVAMLADENIQVDLKFNSQDNTIKSVLSLVPKVFLEDIKDVKTDGNFEFKGFAKGFYNAQQMPAFGLDFKLDNGNIRYPDLPTAIRNLNFELHVKNEDGVIDNTSVNIPKFHVDLGKNPIDGNLMIKDLKKFPIDGAIKGTINLTDLADLAHQQGLKMKGVYKIDINAHGYYDSLTNTIPVLDGSMSLTDGYFESKDFPIPVEGMNFTAKVQSPEGKMSSTTMMVDNFRMMMEQETFTASMKIFDLNDPKWDIKAQGNVDLATMAKAFKLDSMELEGKIYADITTKGKMSDVEKEAYDKLPTSGKVNLKNLIFISPDFPQGVRIASANAVFNPKNIELSNLSGKIGNSDMNIKGKISNYIAYALKDETLRGTMTFNSTRFNLNQFMVEAPEDEEVAKAETKDPDSAQEVVVIPKNLDLTFMASIKETIYDQMVLKNLKGKISLKNGLATLDGVNFNTMGGKVGMSGVYNSTNVKKPSFGFNFDMSQIDIPQAYASLNTVQAAAPIAKEMNGKFSTNFSMKGILLKDMSPDMNTMDGSGDIEIREASVKNSGIVKGISAISGFSSKSENINMKDVIIKTRIENGRVKVQPFDVKIGEYTATIDGSNGFDKSLDYNMKVLVPTKGLGKEANKVIGDLFGTKTDVVPEAMRFNFKVDGNYDKPKYKLVGTESVAGKSSSKSNSSNANKETQKTDVKKEAQKILDKLF